MDEEALAGPLVLTALQAYAEDAIRLRAEAPPFRAEDSHREVMAKLALVRTLLDQAEDALMRALLTRSRARDNRTVQEATAEDVWAEKVRQVRSRKVMEALAPREVYAQADLETMELRARARTEKRVAEMTQEVAEVVRVCLRGLEGVRADFQAQLRTFALEASLERST